MKRKPVDMDDIPRCETDCESVHLDHEGVKHVTKDAALVLLDGEETWMPKSVILSIDESELEVALWFAEKEGWA